VLVLPGTIVEVPGWFRVSLTASDEMVEASLPRFAAAMHEARATRP
jgi:aspartate aminotransferase